MMDARALEQTRNDGVNLTRRHRLHEVRRDIGAQRFHERRIFLALGDHDDVQIRRDLAELAKGVEATHAGHLFVEKNEIECTAAQQLSSILGVGRRFDNEAFISRSSASSSTQSTDFPFAAMPRECSRAPSNAGSASQAAHNHSRLVE